MYRERKRIPSLRWLAFAVLITAMISTVTLSRYMTTVSGTDSITVANVAMGDMQLDLDTQELEPGGTIEYTFAVTNYTGADAVKTVSDVTQEYTVVVQDTGNLPLEYTLKGSSKDDVGITVDEWNISNMASIKGILPHTSEATHTYTLMVSWPSVYNSPEYANMIDLITVTVDSRQSMLGKE